MRLMSSTGEPPTLQRLRQRLESEQTSLDEVEQEVSQNRSKLDSYEQQVNQEKARMARYHGGNWLNLAGFGLSVGGASAIIAGAGLGVGPPAYVLGGVALLAGGLCFGKRMRQNRELSKVGLEARNAQLGYAACKIHEMQLQARRSRQAKAVQKARQDYERAHQPLSLLPPAPTSTVQEQEGRILIGGVVIARRSFSGT